MRFYNYLHRGILPLCVIVMGALRPALAQTTIYSETFSGQNDKGATGPGPAIDLAGVTWTIDVSAAGLGNGDYFRVVDGVLEGLDLDGPAVWFSPTVNISGYTNVSFALSASEAGSHESDDYYDVEYRVDGGAWQKLLDWDGNGSLIRTLVDDWGSALVGQSGLTGSTLELRITMNNDSDFERMRLDNVVVIGDLPRLVINEVSYNPCSPSQGSDSNCEFIEIYNPGSSAVNLMGYQLAGTVDYTFATASIAAGEYIIIARNAANVSACYTVNPIPGGTQIFDWGSENLSNTSGNIYFLNSNDILIDQFSYDDGGAGDDCPDDADGNCATLQYTGAGDNTDCLSGNWATDAPTPGAENSAVLPIELLAFSGRAEGAAIRLTWTTASERDNDYMAVERSPDGLAFDEIGRVAGRGTTYAPQTYTFLDAFPAPGVNYYRLRQVDFDGATEYHPVISVVFAARERAPLGMHVYPNPAREEVRVQWSGSPSPSPQREGHDAAAAILRVFDSNGRQLAQYALNGSGGVYNVPLGTLPAGVYVLQLVQGGQVKVERVVKN